MAIALLRNIYGIEVATVDFREGSVTGTVLKHVNGIVVTIENIDTITSISITVTVHGVILAYLANVDVVSFSTTVDFCGVRTTALIDISDAIFTFESDIYERTITSIPADSLVNKHLIFFSRPGKVGYDIIVITDLTETGIVIFTSIIYSLEIPIGSVVITSLLDESRAILTCLRNGREVTKSVLVNFSQVVITVLLHVRLVLLGKRHTRRKDEGKREDACDLEKLSHGLKVVCVQESEIAYVVSGGGPR